MNMKVGTSSGKIGSELGHFHLHRGDTVGFLDQLPGKTPIFDLVVTSPPYSLGKEYERHGGMLDFITLQIRVIERIVPLLKQTGSVCWQVGNYVNNGYVEPLDMVVHPIFTQLGLKLRNRIIWRFGHGLHCRRRFSGRYEVILWYTRSEDYKFNLDDVRIGAKYPGKRFYKGPRKGELSSNPLGKNPEDVWDIPNVVGNHREKTIHPCQFPVGLAERLVLALSGPTDLVFDPFCGVGSTGVAAAAHGRRFWGCDRVTRYIKIANKRVSEAVAGVATYRPHGAPVYDHRESPLSLRPAN